MTIAEMKHQLDKASEFVYKDTTPELPLSDGQFAILSRAMSEMYHQQTDDFTFVGIFIESEWGRFNQNQLLVLGDEIQRQIGGLVNPLLLQLYFEVVSEYLHPPEFMKFIEDVYKGSNQPAKSLIPYALKLYYRSSLDHREQGQVLEYLGFLIAKDEFLAHEAYKVKSLLERAI